MGDGGACHHQMGWAGGQVCLGRVGKSIVQFGLVKSSMLIGYQSGQIDMNLDLGRGGAADANMKVAVKSI